MHFMGVSIQTAELYYKFLDGNTTNKLFFEVKKH